MSQQGDHTLFLWQSRLLPASQFLRLAGRGAEFKKRETPFRGGEKRNECLWLKERLQRVADFILAAT